MSHALRLYQLQAVAGVHQAWRSGHRSVCLVAPTGSGKTIMGVALVAHQRALWIAHRRELVLQAAGHLRAELGRLEVGVIAPGEQAEPFAPVQVATVQTLLARANRPAADLLVLDEAHHYVAEDWQRLVEAYPDARIVGLTATPERRDGRPLGDIFSEIVVAAAYSELLQSGHLVPCRVYQPPEILGTDLAVDPLEAYKRHCNQERCFVFVATVEQAYTLAERFRTAGIPAQTIEAKTPKPERDQTLQDFAAGSIRVICNVYALTEGVDVPAARACILARACEHVGMFLQIAGRILRPAPGKTDAVLVDLTGATLRHGLPTEDRRYSLEGEGIIRTSPIPVRNCTACGACVPAWQRACPECGFEPPPPEVHRPKIYSMELREVFAGADTPQDAKQREYQRLREVARKKGWALYWVQKEFKKLFGVAPVIIDADHDEHIRELARLLETVRSRGFKPGFAAVRFKELFGRWPTGAEKLEAAQMGDSL